MKLASIIGGVLLLILFLPAHPAGATSWVLWEEIVDRGRFGGETKSLRIEGVYSTDSECHADAMKQKAESRDALKGKGIIVERVDPPERFLSYTIFFPPYWLRELGLKSWRKVRFLCFPETVEPR